MGDAHPADSSEQVACPLGCDTTTIQVINESTNKALVMEKLDLEGGYERTGIVFTTGVTTDGKAPQPCTEASKPRISIDTWQMPALNEKLNVRIGHQLMLQEGPVDP